MVWEHFNKPFSPFEVTLPFSDQGPEYSKTIDKTYISYQDKDESKIFHTQTLAAVCNSPFALMRRFLKYVLWFTEPHNLQQLEQQGGWTFLDNPFAPPPPPRPHTLVSQQSLTLLNKGLILPLWHF